MVSVVYVDNKLILIMNTTQKQTFSLKYPPKFNCECHHICNLQHSTHKYNWRFSQLVNCLTLKINKTNIIEFCSKHYQDETFLINYQNNPIKESIIIKFLGLKLDKHTNWKNHINKILTKVSSACFVVRSMYTSSNMSTLKVIYFAYIHATIRYGIIFWQNSIHSKKVFLLQKRVIRIMTGLSCRISCKPLFQRVELLTLSSQYIIFLMRSLSQNLKI